MSVYAERITHSKPRAGYLAAPDEQEVRNVLEFAAWAFGVTTNELTGSSRRHPIVDYRQEAMAACRELTDASYLTIARVFDRDHTTVVHAVQRRSDDPSVAELVASFRTADWPGRVAL